MGGPIGCGACAASAVARRLHQSDQLVWDGPEGSAPDGAWSASPLPVGPPIRHTAGMTTDPPAVNDDGHRLSTLIDTLIADARMRDAPPAATAAAVRYILAILATDARGHTCRFPHCPCPIMDCSRLPR